MTSQQFPAYTHFKCFSATAFSRYIFSTFVAALSVILYLGKNLVTWRGMSGLMEAITALPVPFLLRNRFLRVR